MIENNHPAVKQIIYPFGHPVCQMLRMGVLRQAPRDKVYFCFTADFFLLYESFFVNIYKYLIHANTGDDKIFIQIGGNVYD